MNHRDPITNFITWEYGIRQWVSSVQERDSSYLGFAPKQMCHAHTAENAEQRPQIRITSPSAFSPMGLGFHEVQVEISAPLGAKEVRFFFDENPNFTAESSPWSGTVRITPFTKEGKHLIRAKVYDSVGYVGESSIEIDVIKEQPEKDEVIE